MKAFCMIASIWFVVVVFAIMPILGWNEYVYVDDRKHCMIYWQSGGTDSAYGVFLSLSSFVIPTWIMVFCYVKIFSTARKQAKKVAQSRGWNMAASCNKGVPSYYDESDTTRGVLAFPYRNMNNLMLESIESVGPNTEDFEEKDPEKQVVSFDQQRNHSLNNSELFTGKDKNSGLTKAVSRDRI